MTLKTAKADTAPAHCATEYVTSSVTEMAPFKYMAKLTAGLTWPPLVSPIIKIIPARVAPMASQLPVNKIAVKRANVPTNSAASARNFMSSNNGGLKIDLFDFR